MTHEELFAWVAGQYGIAPEYPWGDTNSVLRHRENRKWFAAVLEVGRDKLGLTGGGTVFVVNVKCDPRLIGSLLGQPGFHRAYHMNKEKWLSIRLDGSADADTIRSLVSMSYDLTGIQNRGKKHGI